MAHALISGLLERLASTTYEYIEGELKHVLNVKEDVEKFTATLEVIQAVLEDAEQRQVTEASVKIWLDKLKDISYQMVDVLDEWNTDILKQQVEKREREGDPNALVTKKKVRFSRCFCFGKVSRVILRRDIALKIKDLNHKLTEIYEERKKYQFLRKELGIQQPQQPQRPQTASFVDISEIFGRENEKKVLITNLLSDSSAEGKGLLIIPIVGMGGMGKTTLTQLAYNDDNVKAHFEIRKWVCVSDPFDEIKIAKDISGDCATSSNQLDYVLQRMSESIQGKRFLLVLDDVWTENRQKWELLKVPLMQNGAKGSIILVTTRKIEVANMIRATPNMINLEGLSDEYCLAIFNHMAFPDGDVDESKAFEDISKKIVKKCKGLPLAAKTLGSLMQNKRTKREWKEVLNSKIWDLEKVEQEVFQPLLLSYYDLSPTIKCCLLYCATFPKDYTFERDRLIELWMAQDYVISKWNKQKGTTGDVVFDNLVARSFLQDFQKDPDTGTITWCKMHDIVHDFVQFLTKNECLIMDHTECATSESKLLGDKVRHLTLRYFLDGPLAISSSNCQKLRTLTTFDSRITTIDSNLILQLKCLRTLNLSGNSIKELPEEIGELKHLRHIDLSYNSYLEKLPDTICGLYNLSTLRLMMCSELKKLPENMGNLINLKHLYVDWCEDLKSLPKGIGRLTSLRILDACRCGGDNDEAFQIGDLRNLNLEGSLEIQLVGDATNKSEVEKAQLWDKKLFHLAVAFEWQTNSNSSSVEILNALRPHPDLDSFIIRCYNGTTWPNWMQSLHNLRFLNVARGTQSELWPLGKLEFLETLSIWSMEGVRKVGVEFLGLEDQTSFRIRSPPLIFFPKLKRLCFDMMRNWEEWEGVEEWTKEDSEITIMPCLSKLEMKWCPLLKALPDFLFKTPLQTLRITGSERLLERYEEGNGEWAKISATNPNIRIIR
ncbi:PREDICTED: putative disease resistance protein RGA3 isoform X2 [Prunus mume]|nr:PREDICTED: putative disease resistance protein RGA3 isoform X2 [Prunus mume]